MTRTRGTTRVTVAGYMTATTILSPHLDDAVLSCWHVLTGPGEVAVVNVFAGVPPAGAPVGWWDRLSGDGGGRARGGGGGGSGRAGGRPAPPSRSPGGSRSTSTSSTASTAPMPSRLRR